VRAFPRNVFVVLISLILATPVFAGKCLEILLSPETIEQINKGQDVEVQFQLAEDPLFQNLAAKSAGEKRQALMRLLQMSGYTLFYRGQIKDVKKDGEIHLAAPITEDSTVELIYKADLRQRYRTYRLREIIFVKPSGYKFKLSNNPLTDSGRHLRTNTFTLKTSADSFDVVLTENAVSLQGQPATEDTTTATAADMPKLLVPLEISGDVLDQFANWAERFGAFEAEDLRTASQPSDLIKMRLHNFWYSHFSLVTKRVKNLYSKALVLGALFGGAVLLTSQTNIEIPFIKSNGEEPVVVPVTPVENTEPAQSTGSTEQILHLPDIGLTLVLTTDSNGKILDSRVESLAAAP